MTALAEAGTFQLREACPDDNAALISLAAASPMEGDIALRVDRAPDFFALNRLEGDAWRVAVACGPDGRVAGCVGVARRRAYVNAEPREVAYVSDLKVLPEARGSGVADLLTEHARETCAELCGDDASVLCTILAGNRRMERRARGPRGTPALSRVATLWAMAIPLLFERRERAPDAIRIRHATLNDLEQMSVAWRRYAVRRQFASVMDTAALDRWMHEAPGLRIDDYLLALDRQGRVRGFLGIWDQRAFKQLRVVGYSRRLAWTRRALTSLAWMAGAAPLPLPGEVLPALATVHACADDPGILRAVLLEAYRRHRGGRHAFLTIGLDGRDPLWAATSGLLAQTTLVHAYVTTPRGSADLAAYHDAPVHHEMALV